MPSGDFIRCEIRALETPRVERHCPKCKRSSIFTCSEKFRINAQQKHLDVWLIYLCMDCESTWNFPILTRIHSARIDPGFYRKVMGNDRATAWHCAFRLRELSGACDRIVPGVAYAVGGGPVAAEEGTVAALEFGFSHYFELRLDNLLKELTGIPRSALQAMAADGRIETCPPVKLHGRVVDGMRVKLTF